MTLYTENRSEPCSRGVQRSSSDEEEEAAMVPFEAVNAESMIYPSCFSSAPEASLPDRCVFA